MSSLVPSATVSARMRQEFATHRRNLSAAEERIHSYVSEHTQAERAALEAAHQALHNRQTALLAEAEMQQQQQAHRKALEQLESLGAKLQELQRKAMRKIRELDVSDEEKLGMWEQVQEAIERIVHSDDELKALRAFKKQFRTILAQRQIAE